MRIVQLAMVFAFFALPGMAQPQINTPKVLSVDAFLSVDKIRPGDKFKIGVEFTLHGKWHINSHVPSEEFLIPTAVTFTEAKDVQFGEPAYPAGESRKFAFSETPLSVYEGTSVIWADVQAEDLQTGELLLSGKLNYQACNDMSCLAPTGQAFQIAVPVVAAGTNISQINQDKFASHAGKLSALAGERAQSGNEIGKLISGSGLLLALGFIFLGGLALNLTPCVYPIIPITISFFVGQSSGKMSRSFFLALVYILGMSLTYSALGVVAAMTGGLLGSSLQNPMVTLGIAVVFLAFAASMFGAFEIRVPTFLNNLAGGSKQGVFGSLFMGLTVGIVAAPCIGPFVLSLLTYVAVQGDPFIGFLLFFVLSLGLGLPFLILGTFSGSVKNLPRSGEWMNWVKKVFGVVMIAIAIYFISSLIPQKIYVALLSVSLILGGLLVGFIDKSTASFAWFGGIKKIVGIALISYGAWNATDAWLSANAPHVSWEAYDEVQVTEAKASGKPILIDFYADWCLPCKQIDHDIFGAIAVVDASAGFVTLKADLTKEDSEMVTNLRNHYQVRGVPTIILIDKNGQEYRRFTDELVHMVPEEFAKLMAEAGGAVAANHVE